MSEVKTAKTEIAKTDRFLAREAESPVVKELKERAFLRVQLGQWVEITCPDCGGRGCYVLPSENTPVPGVYACACGMTTASLLAFLKISEFDPASRQKITQSPETKQTLLLKALFNRGFFLAPRWVHMI